MRHSVITPIAAGLLMAMAGASHAATKNSSFQVSATVSKNCVISSQNLNLGTFDGTNDLVGSSTISVNCTGSTNFSVDLDKGSSGNYTMRTLVNGADTLNYNLYTTNTYTTVWGDTTGGTGHVTGTGTGMGAPNTQLLTVYGRLRATDNVAGVGAGSYSDSITATITY